jgi:hypothetical protein
MSHEKEEKLLIALSTMDVPRLRVENKDWRWLLRNLGIRNSRHPMFQTAIKLLKQVLKNK